MRMLVALLTSVLLVSACASSDESADSAPDESPVEAVPADLRTPVDTTVTSDSLLSGTARVQYINLEGGFYGLVDDVTERRMDPQNLDEDFQVDGLRVTYRARTRPDVMTMRMWGTPVEILSMERVDE